MRSLVVLFSLLMAGTLQAQVVFQDTLYVDADNKVINRSLKEEAHSYIVRKLNKNNNLHGDINRYYANGQVYEAFQYIDGKQHGPFASYTPTGQLLVQGTYKRGQKAGIEKKWFENGQLHYEIEYVNRGTMTRQRIINEWNREGKQLIKEGEGFVTLHFADLGYFEEGNYKDGFKEGEWMGTFVPSGQRYFIESYSGGQLMGGTSFDAAGNSFDYSQVGNAVGFKGGRIAWQKYLKDNLKYPRKQQRMRNQAVVRISAVINEEGKLTMAKVLEPTLPAFDQEALRLVANSPVWSPASTRGQKISSRITLNIHFKLRFDERGRVITEMQHRDTVY